MKEMRAYHFDRGSSTQGDFARLLAAVVGKREVSAERSSGFVAEAAQKIL